ncbi:MAG: T9SS type A sorting domain-containing protein, partial [Bacteroidota bacterium]
SNAADSAGGIFIGILDIGSQIPTIEKLNDIKIFPNPASDNLMVAATDEMMPMSIEVYDILGKRISVSVEKKSANLSSVNVHDLKNGFYFIQLKMKDGSVTTRRFTKN